MSNNKDIFDVVTILLFNENNIFDENYCKILNNYMITRILSFHNSKKVKVIAETINRYTFLQFDNNCLTKLFFLNLCYSLTPKWNKKQYICYTKKDKELLNEEIYDALKKEFGNDLSTKELRFIYEYLYQKDKKYLTNILIIHGVQESTLIKLGLIDKPTKSKTKKGKKTQGKKKGKTTKAFF